MADNSLYGIHQPSKTKAKEISSSTALAFSTNLASLISNASSKSSISNSRARPSKSNSDIFSTHNKNIKKRAAADLVENDTGEQKHKTEEDIGGVVDSATLHRSKRRMEEKARLYAAMKRGDYIRQDDGRDSQSLVDFDRKWADQEAQRAADHDNSHADSSDSSDERSSNGEEEMVEYLDEFGRNRLGTKAQAAREERRKRVAAQAADEEEQFSARPKMPTNIIYGDTIQHNAFNPDQAIADRMAELAKKRDRSATPPDQTHYDANAEVRNKGTGFYGFSKDAEGRKKEMDALERERLDTERVRRERETRKEERRKALEERKRAIAEQKGRMQADRFLRDLDLDDKLQEKNTDKNQVNG